MNLVAAGSFPVWGVLCCNLQVKTCPLFERVVLSLLLTDSVPFAFLGGEPSIQLRYRDIFNLVQLLDSKDLLLRRRALYPAELQKPTNILPRFQALRSRLFPFTQRMR